MSTEIHISPAHRDDLSAIMGLEQIGFAEAERWSERSWLGELQGEGRTVLIARAQAPVGVITVQTIGELADLHRLVVAPNRRRSGIGTALVLEALSVARHHGARAVILEVFYWNDPAIALYSGLGFEQLATRQNYYGPGRHALILKLYDLDRWPPKEQSR